MKKDFTLSKFYSYSGPNYYLDRQALVFNVFIDPEGPMVSHYRDEIVSRFPLLEESYPDRVVDLFARVLVQVLKMDMDLFLRRYSIDLDEDEYAIALEYLDEYVAREAVYFVRDWFLSMNGEIMDFDFEKEFNDLKKIFDKTIFGGPTIYSLIEGAINRKINVHYLPEENQFQFGYGKKQIRGRSTTIHIDSVKDTEFTSYKDMVGEFLELCQFPTPKGVVCFREDDAVEEALAIGFPVVVKPVAGHKGQGVVTAIESESEVRKAYKNIEDHAEKEGVTFDGALVQEMIYGFDHRILTVGGKYAACLKRVPAYVVGNGKDTIEKLIEVENDKDIRIDNNRSPLAKIVIDDDLTDYLELQGLSLESVPADEEKITLRRVANISAGGVSINVTDEIHPDNIRLVEHIAKFLKVTILGIDVLARDISKSWRDGDFGIIEINAGPGVFMHLAPAYGGAVDVPGIVMEHLFGKVEGFDRIPIIVGNRISDNLFSMLTSKLQEYKRDVEVSTLREDGIYINGDYFTKNPHHDKNCQILFRNRNLDFAMLNHSSENIHDHGIWHQGHDVAILDRPNYAEEVLRRDVLPGGILLEITENLDDVSDEGLDLSMYKDGEKLESRRIEKAEELDTGILELLDPHLQELLFKYDCYLRIENTPQHLELNAEFVKQINSN